MADFTQRYHQQRWDVRFVGTVDSAAAAGGQGGQGGRGSSEDAYGRINVAEAVITEENNLLFEGAWGQRSYLYRLVQSKRTSGKFPPEVNGYLQWPTRAFRKAPSWGKLFQ